jgi:hypothetical protein
MYAIPSLDAQDAANTAIQAAFASQTAPATQGIAPTFQWRNLP